MFGRYKSIIESRKSNTSSQTTNPFVNTNDNNNNKNNGSNQLSEDLKLEKSSEPQKQRKTIVRNTPVFGSGPKIEGSSSAQTLPSRVSPTSEDDNSFESTPSLNHLKSSQISSERTPRTAFNEVSNCESELNSQLSVPSVRAVTTSTSTSASTSSSSTSFNKSCTSKVNTNCDGKSKVRPLSAPETSIEDFIAHQLTDDEKAILQRNTRNNIIDENTQMGAKNMNSNCDNCENKDTGITTSANKPKSGNDRSKPRIITLSRPLPKPEPKAAEPKYVNGKLVFGQIPIKPCLAKGSVAERVLLFEKCPEKTSVIKLRKTDRSREKVTYNKVGQWMKLNDNNNNTKVNINFTFVCYCFTYNLLFIKLSIIINH